MLILTQQSSYFLLYSMIGVIRDSRRKWPIDADLIIVSRSATSLTACCLAECIQVALRVKVCVSICWRGLEDVVHCGESL